MGELTSLKNVWDGSSIEEALGILCTNRETRRYRALPINIAWGVWLAINSKLFEDEDTLPLKCVVQCINIVSSFP